MSEVPVAAFDPIFWSHHAMIDRLWYLWQMRHPGLNPPAHRMGEALVPFKATVARVLDINVLEYEYAAQVVAIV
jgi:tyrosinase